ncbi:formylglycine-generating enzyme family protein [Halomonas denitrificans]|nr:formylglycine-generating enzyme family protein [Halomonas denitrificans]
MTSLERLVADWLRRDGRLPDDAMARLPEALAGDVESREQLERIADRLAAENPDLATRRRIVLSIQARMQARGGELPASERDSLLRKARAAGWDKDGAERLMQAALHRMQRPAPPPDQDAVATPQASSGKQARPRSRRAAGERLPLLLAAIGVLGVIVSIGGFLLTRSGGTQAQADAAAPADAQGLTAEEIRTAQRVLARLGQPVAETGRFDAETRAALGRALPQYAAIEELEPWLVDRLRVALARADDTAWQSALAGGSAEAMNDYLQRFPDGRHAQSASERLLSLEASEERTGIVRAMQREMNRLGRDIAESGEFDQATRDALAGFPGPTPDRTRSSLAAALETLRGMKRWPPAAGESFRDCASCPEMVALPAGRFTMGSPPDELMRSANEGPQREVDVPRFALSKFEITLGQWQPCVGAGICPDLPVPTDSDWTRLPVTHVTWMDALAYVRWLREQTGFDYRLPSEAEWEYAARAGTNTRYATGDCITAEQANFDARVVSGDCPQGTFRDGPLPVGSFPPNAFGLHDMHGNVLEPTRDCWNSDYRGAPTDGSPWDRGDCGRAPLRGGSWSSSDRELRSAARIRPGAANRNPTAGLRVAVPLPETPAMD